MNYLPNFKCLYPDVLNGTSLVYHDADVRSGTLIKQSPLRINPQKANMRVKNFLHDEKRYF